MNLQHSPVCDHVAVLHHVNTVFEGKHSVNYKERCLNLLVVN